MNPIENLNQLAQFTPSGNIPTELLNWLNQCLSRWQSGESLPNAFNIYDNTAERKYRRDIQLREYASMLTGSTWHRAKILALETSLIRQGRRNVNPMLVQIDQIARLPETTRQFFNILKS